MTSAIAIVVVITFFVTSSDSGSLVIDIIIAGGNTEPPKSQRIFRAVTERLVADGQADAFLSAWLPIRTPIS